MPGRMKVLVSGWFVRGLLCCLPVLLLGGCTLAVNEPESGRSPEASAVWTAGIVSEPGQGEERPVLLTGVRTGRHKGYDRLVFTFKGGSLPGYHLEYIDHPVRECGSGKVLGLPGDGWLLIRFRPARMHDAGGTTVSPLDRELGYPVVLRLVRSCDFEGTVAWVAAVAEPEEFRAFALEGPTRLVVDISH